MAKKKKRIYIYIWCIFKDGESLGGPWGQREDCAPMLSLLQNYHFQGHQTCSQVLLSHSLPLTWVTKNLPAPLWKPMVFTKTSQQSPNKRKLKQKENITSKWGPFLRALPSAVPIQEAAGIDFPWERKTKGTKSLRGRQARQRLISHLSVLSFPTVQKSISDEFLWKLLKQCYFIKDLCQHHRIHFPGVN